MELVIFRNKNRFRVRDCFYQLHTLRQPQDKTGGAQGIPFHGGAGEYGNAKKSVFHRIPGFGVQDMMI